VDRQRGEQPSPKGDRPERSEGNAQIFNILQYYYLTILFGFFNNKPYFSVHPLSGMFHMLRSIEGRLVGKLLLAFMLLAAPCAWAQGGESISLYVKTTVYPFDSTAMFGHGKVEATLRYTKGAPIPGQEIQLNTGFGVFSCKLPDIENLVDSSSSDTSCFRTGNDGKILVYLINIPFNSQGVVMASCVYNGIAVKATSTFWIKRMVVTKMKSKKAS
jgi:hypothetical protein